MGEAREPGTDGGPDDVFEQVSAVVAHFSGDWMDTGAQSYLKVLMNHWKNKDWLPK